MSGIKNKAELMLSLLYAGELEPGNVNQKSTLVKGITRLEKLLFLLKKEKEFLKDVGEENDFHFFPFKMGPWTNEVYDEVDFLESLGLLEKTFEGESTPADDAYVDELFSNSILDKYQKNDFNKEKSMEVFGLTKDGKAKALNIWQRLSQREKEEIIEIKRKFNKMNLKEFLRYVYKKYPEYTSESEIKDTLNL